MKGYLDYALDHPDLFRYMDFIAGQRACRRTSLAVGLIGPEHPWKTSRVELRSYVSATQQIPVKRTTTDADGGFDLGKVGPENIACSLPLQERLNSPTISAVLKKSASTQ